MRSLYNRITIAKIVLGFVLTALCALSAHLVLLQVLNVPFPELSIFTLPSRYILRFVQTIALFIFCQAASKALGSSFIKKLVAIFVIVAMLNESLFRADFMQAYCTTTWPTAWAHALIGNLPSLFTLAFTCAVVVACAPRAPLAWQKFACAALIAAVSIFVVTPLLRSAMAPIMASLSNWVPKSEWCVLPYGAKILIPAYLSFAEPTLACFAAAILSSNGPRRAPLAQLVEFTLVIMALKTQLVTAFIYAFLMKGSFLSSVISEGQFSVEAMTLAVFSWMSLEWARSKQKLA